jgi:3-methyladenine DNA glycosylase AlkD
MKTTSNIFENTRTDNHAKGMERSLMNRGITNKYHLELISEVRTHATQLSPSQKEKFKTYIGTSKVCYAIGAETERRIIKEWVKKHSDLAASEYIELLGSLYQGESINEISIAGELLGSLPGLRKNIKPKYLDMWLTRVQGWAEVDSLCQSKFTAIEVLENWKEWKRLLTKLSSESNVHKKRASLVLLTKPARDSEDPRLADLAFMNIDKLKAEQHILITKAISWLLRDLIRHNRQRVERYLRENEETLPKIAVRETRTRLLTGRKTPVRSNGHKSQRLEES